MKKTFTKMISVLMLITMLLSTGIVSIVSSASSEADYKATFSIVTDKTSVKAGEEVKVSVKLKTNYYICAMELPVIYDGDAFKVQNTSPTSLKSFLTFEGRMASAYRTNGNWKSPAEFYTTRNSNTEFWSQKAIMDRYKIAFASWSSDSTLNGGKLVKLSNEETIISFTLKAQKDISDIAGLIFIHKDFLKTESFAGGRWSCGRSKTEKFDAKNIVAVGQTITFTGKVPNMDGNNNTDDGKVEDGVIAINFKATKCLEDELNETILKDYKLKWTSEDESIVTVDEDGNIYGVAPGETTVTVKSTDGKFTKTFDVKVSYSIIQWIIIIVLFGWIWYV